MKKDYNIKDKNLFKPWQERIIILLLVLIGIFGIICVAKSALVKSEKTECEKWQVQAQELPGFYLTNWQKMQCDYYNIEIE